MEAIQTYHEFMLYTKNIIYGLIILILLAMPAIWLFLNGKDEE